MATQEEKDSATDLIYQLEALNPTPDATNVNTIGEMLLLSGVGRAAKAPHRKQLHDHNFEWRAVGRPLIANVEEVLSVCL